MKRGKWVCRVIKEMGNRTNYMQQAKEKVPKIYFIYSKILLRVGPYVKKTGQNNLSPLDSWTASFLIADHRIQGSAISSSALWGLEMHQLLTLEPNHPLPVLLQVLGSRRSHRLGKDLLSAYNWQRICVQNSVVSTELIYKHRFCT